MASVKDLTFFGVNVTDARKISVADFDALVSQGCRPEVGDVLIAKDGNSALDTVCLQREAADFVLLSSVAILRPDPEVIDSRYLTYVLRNPPYIEYLKANFISGAAIPRVVLRDFKRAELTAPPTPEQRAIAATLGALDDKIELNRKMNATLEAMARALFRDWFVDFGPTRAKMEGRAPYLSPDLWALFPDRIDEEGKPEGWEVRPIGDFAELKGGKQLEKEHIVDVGPVPVFGGAGLMGYTANHNADGFVISVGRVGAYCGRFFSHRGKAWINNNASLIRPNADVSGEWLLIALRHIDMDVIKKGAAQPFVSNSDIAKVGIVWPGNAIISAFSDDLVSLIKKAEANERQSRTLAQTRDLLLPRLMSGELRVAEAERIVEEVV
ncbi:restriction endonuclease subunit S [Yoonia sp.]|uniref:restriction endonuclease subunit S n=1 Tax=Yoonia sp. TaxID=2212373 RepID=UPI003F72583F